MGPIKIITWAQTPPWLRLSWCVGLSAFLSFWLVAFANRALHFTRASPAFTRYLHLHAFFGMTLFASAIASALSLSVWRSRKSSWRKPGDKS